MRLRSLLLLITLTLTVLVAYADNNYKVVSSSSLNVRKTPSVKSAIIGKLQNGQEIEVISVEREWATVNINNKIGYVNKKYIVPLSTPSADGAKIITNLQMEKEPFVVERKVNTNTFSYSYDESVDSDLSLSSKTDLYLSIQAGCGFSNFLWNNGVVNGTISYSADVALQLYLNERVVFIPKDWYSELSLGYDKKGAAKFDMNYVHAQIYPFGYKFDVKPLSLVVKGGALLSYPLGDLGGRWKSDFQVGAICGLQIEWNLLSVGCSISYDFTEVSSSCSQKLNNYAILGTISCKLFEL